MLAALAALDLVALAATPEFRLGAGVPEGTVPEAESAWARLEALHPADQPATPVAIEVGADLPAGHSGASTPGVIRLRRGLDARRLRTSLAHEVAHQFLLQRCPAASDDRLFHEGLAIAVSGELADFGEEDYLAGPVALQRLERAVDRHALDTPAARAALARLLAEAPDPLLPSLRQRLAACGDGVHWLPLTPRELLGNGERAGDALLVLSRHSGEVFFSRGDVRTARPFGSTLKPFLVAGAGSVPPELTPDTADPQWACGDALPATIDAREALPRSCNGYFFEWARRDPKLATFGSYGPVLSALGLSRSPADISEAIGLRPTLSLSPLALAQAYRLLGAARPEVIATLTGTAERGTLAGLSVSPALSGWALKTGTVRDPLSRVTLGWIVGVDPDLVVVMVRRGQMPRDFAGAFALELSRARSRPARGPAEVQVFGLFGAERQDEIEATCPAVGVEIGSAGPRLLGARGVRLSAAVASGPALCLGSAFRVRLPGAQRVRSYAGSFRADPLAHPPPEDSSKAERARAGSSLVFTTSLDRYAAGVVAAEGAGLSGGAHDALVEVVASNAAHGRHAGRPPCDTSHCQVFLGTVEPGADELAALMRAPQGSEWLPFARGGSEPWQELRSLPEVAAALGTKPITLDFADGRVRVRRAVADAEGVYEEQTDASCEWFRNRLKLPSCPQRAQVSTGRGRVRFEGVGAGHGLGLDLEAAQASGKSAGELLDAAYGKELR